MDRRLLGTGALIAALTAAGAGQAKEIQRIRWLAGCWEMEQGGRRVLEQWTNDRGGLMLGTSRTLQDGRAIGHEFSAILPDSSGKLELQAYPAGQKPATFALQSVSDTGVTFTNPTHDFPTSIHYVRRKNDSIIASIEGPGKGGTRRVVFPYRRVACEAPDEDGG